jgi:coronin-1B/1C/6
MFQSDIYPPTTGLRPGITVGEWFGGKTALPPKISLESVYEGEAPKEVAADYKPPQPASTQPSPIRAEAPKAPEPAPVVSRGPPPQLKDNKDSLSSQASRFADKDVDSDKESESSFEQVSKPIQRPSVTAIRQEEKTKGPVMTKEPEPVKPTPAPAAAPVQSKPAPPAAESTPPPTAAPTSSPSPAAAGGPAAALRDALSDIKGQLENQNKIMSDQSDQIALLLREVTQLKANAQEPSGREKDERIRQLELELEEARS